MQDTTILVATHNVMNGEMGSVMDFRNHYVELSKNLGRPIDIFCIQENSSVVGSDIWFADRLARFLEIPFPMDTRYTAFLDRYEDSPGSGIFGGGSPRFEDVAIIWNHKRLYAKSFSISEIPRLTRYGWVGRKLGTDEPQQRKISTIQMQLDSGRPFTVLNFHLDAWGGTDVTGRRISGNALKAHQLTSAVESVRKQFGNERLVACGDTNIFSLPKSLQIKTLNKILSRLNLEDPGKEGTHHFSRIEGDDLGRRIVRLLGEKNILPSCKPDVIASDMVQIEHGVVETPESDHDLVWAIIQTS